MTRSALMLTMLVLSAGCSSLAGPGLTKTLAGKFGKPELPHAGELTEVLTLWQPGEGRDSGGVPTRGFAGQLFFFKPGSESPTPIDADLVVYVFDDAGTPKEQREPLHRFHFSSEALQQYHRSSEVGDCYQLFLPYTRPGEHHAVCSLRVVVQPRNGSRAMSPAADVTLPGRREAEVLAPVDWTTQPGRPSGKVKPREKLNVYSIPLTTGRTETRK